MKDQRTSERGKAGFSRRAFLRGSGAAAAATAIAGGTGLAEANQNASAVVGPGLTKITLTANGKQHSLEVEPRMTLLEVLRYKLGLTGAKPVSVDGSSGASSVFLNDRLVAASTVLAVECAGKQIRTVESLGGANPDPVPTAFTEHDASQCGFCTPGFVVAVRAFLDKNPSASEADIRKKLNGNLCRCGTYANVVMAAMELAKSEGGSRG